VRQDADGTWHDDYSDGPVWHWFGLGYSSYAVLPRRAICSMPLDWQHRFVALMNEAHDLLPPEAHADEYFVRARSGGKFASDPNVPYRHAQPWALRNALPQTTVTGAP